MATHAPITGAPTRAPAFADFDLNRLDHLSGDMDSLRSLVYVAIDLVGADSPHCANLLHAALNQYERANNQLQEIHDDLLAVRRAADNA